ncbi:uncharacterized protein LOC143434131 [Arvicanthis niloticus]|uniref:uncharacterized protein LOC143434131 n=1 Tax=Arvicanthis niloticus TaxID=61156 RepID=UPI00403CD2FE
MYVRVPCVFCALRGQKKMSDPLELELQMAVSVHVDVKEGQTSHSRGRRWWASQPPKAVDRSQDQPCLFRDCSRMDLDCATSREASGMALVRWETSPSFQHPLPTKDPSYTQQKVPLILTVSHNRPPSNTLLKPMPLCLVFLAVPKLLQ